MEEVQQRNEIKIFSATATRHLSEKIAQLYGKPLGNVSISRFSDGEFQPSFDEMVRGCDIFIIQSTTPPADNLMELLLMIDAAKRASAHYITAVIPYFGFSRQDRKDRPRVAIGARLVADLLTAAGVTRIMTMDLHAPQIQGFFNVPVDHLYSSSVFIPYIKNLNLPNLTICSPDMGGTARARSYSNRLQTDMVVCSKERKQANKIESITIIGNVEGKDIVIVDDMIDTAGTICKVAQTIIDKGANSVRAFGTHAVLSGAAYDNINKSVLTEVVVTDTIALNHTQDCSKITQLSVAKIFSDAIHHVSEHTSISSLFDH
jgi:ribose-phosphate pyrophosphokinase